MVVFLSHKIHKDAEIHVFSKTVKFGIEDKRESKQGDCLKKSSILLKYG